jgi:ribose 5-phosphate isomerase B
MRYAFGCDHAGYPLKQPLIEELHRQGHEVLDLGTDGPESVDYPTFAARVARAIQAGEADLGLLVCGTGLGMGISANKFAGIRAAIVSEAYSARMARRHTDCNVLCLGARVLGPGAAVDVLRAWCQEGYEGGRHQRRVDMIAGFEHGATGGR